MIDDSRLDAYRRIVEEETQRNEDIDEIEQQIENLRRERQMRQRQHTGTPMNTQLDHGSAVESDPYADLTKEELEELEMSPYEIDFTALSPEQQVRYWSLLSPGEKLCMVRLHLQADREEIAHRLQLPAKILRHLEEDRFALLPSPAAARSYYRAYAGELGVEPEQLIRQYEVLTGQNKDGKEQRSFRMLTSLKPWQVQFVWLTAAVFVLGLALVLFATRDSWGPANNDRTLLDVSEYGQEVDQKPVAGVIYGSTTDIDLDAVLVPASASLEP